MDLYSTIVIIIILTSIFSYIGKKYVKNVPSSISIMSMALITSIIIVMMGNIFPHFTKSITNVVINIDFPTILLKYMLGFMLFAGAMKVRLDDLNNEKIPILLFSTLSVIISTIFVGFFVHYIFILFGIKIPIVHCLLFGALISPTDPIAVLSLMKRAKLSKSLETKIIGESLFNDGVAVVVFLTILELIHTDVSNFSFVQTFKMFISDSIGGLIIGGLIGYICFRLLKNIDDYKTEILLTLSVVFGGYLIANKLEVSGPLSMVCAGIIIGNHGRNLGMSETTKLYMDKFWELIDELLNAILFVIIGFEILTISLNLLNYIWVSLIIVIFLIFNRYISLLIPIKLIGEPINNKNLYILTWGGLRGGISIALALSLNTGHYKEMWVFLTYVVVIFSVLVQGLSMRKISDYIFKPNNI